ncbi:hypothetical protein U1Q18_010905 [Sarracenia purpurea var. burkii]
MEDEIGKSFISGTDYSTKDGDLQEEDVWAVVKERRSEDLSPKLRKNFSKNLSPGSSSSSSAWRLPSAPRFLVPRTNRTHDHEIEFETATDQVAQQSSAPMNIPDWSKIYRNKTKKNTEHRSSGGINGDGDGDGDDGEIVPPHEYVARKLARSQISSFSVCEGIGRTLKGRDLSKVRNAVLTKTGFLE